MKRLKSIGAFWYDFVVGDDWTIAVGVVVALAVTYALAHGHTTAWFVVPVAVVVGLGFSLWRATARGDDTPR